MIYRICDAVTAVVRLVTWVGFAALISTVALQVLARNILEVPMIWTSDVAQLLFAWLIFLGAAIGLRTGAHYYVDMIPDNRPMLNAFASGLGFVAGIAVAWLLLIYGWQLASIRSTATIQSLGISRFWSFLPMPICGSLMAVYLLEMAAQRLGWRQSQ